MMGLGLSHIPRVITGLCLFTAMLACLVAGGVALLVVLAIVAATALLEFYCILWPGRQRCLAKAFGIACCFGIMACAVFRCEYGVILIICAAFLYTATAFLLEYAQGNDGATLGCHAVIPLGLCYIPIPLTLALRLTLQEQFLIIAAVIASDTCAYYVGCLWGKRKIWPRVSPNKSWLGSAGSLAGCVIATVLMGIFVLDATSVFTPAPPWWFWLFLGVVVNIAAQCGDFFESALKRAHGVKDSSRILPGHGGILDRIDSLLFVLLAYHIVGIAYRGFHLYILQIFFPAGQ